MAYANKKVAIVIPLYKKLISEYESISLRQCLKTCNNQEIVFIKPVSLDITSYIQIENPHIVEFEGHFFSSIAGYNRLLINPLFYKKFSDYEYILIYQLDAFVFQDNLRAWCELGLDYVGAPWINVEPVERFRKSLVMSKYSIIRRLKQIVDFGKKEPPWVGNGGLSLRKVRKFYALSVFVSPIISMLGYQNLNEDLIWSLLVPKYFPFFKIATFDQAVNFSIETSPTIALSYLNGEKPFGIHGWYSSKETLSQWTPFIMKEGYVMPI